MKTCPSCQSLIEENLSVCPHCGYDFDSLKATPQRTMMGIPGVDLSIKPPTASSEAPERPIRSTLFGIPARPPEGAQLEENTEPEPSEEEDSKTQVTGGNLLFGNAPSLPSSGGAGGIKLGDPQHDVRSTAMGGFPSIGKSQVSKLPAPSSAEEDSDPSESKTEVASASIIATLRESSEYKSLLHEDDEVHAAPRKHETLVGMSLQDLSALGGEEPGQVPPSINRTLFSLPATQRNDAGLEEESEDLRTQVSAPPSALSQTALGAPVPSLRSPQERPGASTLHGGPASSEPSEVREDKKQALLDRLRRGRERQISEVSEAVADDRTMVLPEKNAAPAIPATLEEESDDLAYASTTVLGRDESQAAATAYAPPQDATVVQKRSELPGASSSVFEDATVQQDLGAIRAQIDPALLAPQPEDLPVVEIEPEELPLLDDVQPLPVAEPAPRPSPAPAPAPLGGQPQFGATPSPAGAARPASHTTPQRTSLAKDPSQVVPKPSGGLGRTFQVAFGVISALALIGSAGLGVIAASLPMWAVASAGVLALVTLVATAAPLGSGARSGVFVLAGLGALGLFGGAAALSLVGPASLLMCVAGLCALAAAIFPRIAKTL